MTRKSALDVILVYLLLFTSGSMLFNQSTNKYLVFVLFISFLAWVLFSDRKIHNRFILYASVFTGFLLVIYFYTAGSLILSSIYGTVIKLFIAYLVLNVVGENFIGVFIKVVVFLAVFSLFGFLSDQLHLFDGLIYKLPRVGDNGYEGIFYLFRYRYVGYDRNNSIFFEPGAYQGILNAALFMLLFVNMNISSTRRWVYILILLVTLYTTFSTTGYLIFAGMFGLFLLKGEIISASAKAAIIGGAVLAIALFYNQFQHVIIEKIESYSAIEDITDNTDRRSFDLLVDMEIIKRHIFGLGYTKYFESFSSIGQTRLGHSSSNGITKTLAIYGLPFFLFYFGSYYIAFARLLGWPFQAIFPFGMLVMFLFGESYFVFAPISLALIVAPLVYKSNMAGNGDISMIDNSIKST